MSDFSRIQRQDAFFRAVLAKVNSSITNPFAINAFISSTVGDLTIDDTLSKSDLLHIATDFRGLAGSHLITETLPTVGYDTAGGADVLKAAQPYANKMIKAFDQLGLPKPKPPKPAPPTMAHNLVNVEVFNAGGPSGIAHSTGASLTCGRVQCDRGHQSHPPLLAVGSPEQIWYSADGLQAAKALGSVLDGTFKYVVSPSMTGNTVALFIDSTPISVKTTATTTTTTTTTTPTVPGQPTTTTTTTIPSDVYTNQQTEPWNPVPCTLGSTQASKK